MKGRSCHVLIRTTERERELLQKRAYGLGMTVSDMVRGLVEGEEDEPKAEAQANHAVFAVSGIDVQDGQTGAAAQMAEEATQVPELELPQPGEATERPIQVGGVPG